MMVKKKIKTLLVSMPWSDLRSPSLQMGCLASFARREGFCVDMRHLYLEIAALIGADICHKFSFSNFLNAGELLFASLLFPDRKKQIAQYLRKYVPKFDVFFKSLKKTLHEVYGDVNWDKYDIVGFTCCNSQLFASLLFAKWIKTDFPNIKILFGGPRVQGKCGESVLKCFPAVDWCIDGEGEIPFVHFLSCFSKPVEGFESKVPGLIYRGSNLNIGRNKREQLSDIGNLPDPDFDQYFNLIHNHPILKNEDLIPYLPIESGRGCMCRCAFCNVATYWNGYRSRPTKEVADQIKRLSEKYRVNRIYFVDNILPNKNVIPLCSAIKDHNNDYIISYDVRAVITKDKLKAMKDTGDIIVQIGIESLSTNLLNKMNKGTRLIDNIQILKFCEELGIEHDSNMITNFPTVSQDDIDDEIAAIDYVAAYRPVSSLSNFVLLQDIPVFKNSAEYGLYNIRNSSLYNKLLPKDIAKIICLTEKSYSSKKTACNYRSLMKRYDDWKKEYNQAIIDNKKLLSYYCFGSILRIEDYRSLYNFDTGKWEGLNSVTIEGDLRDIYLFCDSIRNINEIKKRFPHWSKSRIIKTLNMLIELMVMFGEDDDYLSLAIPANPRH